MFAVNFVYFIGTVSVSLLPPLHLHCLHAHLNGPDQQCSQKAVGVGRPPLGFQVRTGIDSVALFSARLENLSVSRASQSLRFLPSDALGLLWGQRTWPAPLPWSPLPLPQTPTSFIAAAAARGQPGRSNPSPTPLSPR